MNERNYISLICVDPLQNKWRSYTIQLMMEEGVYQIDCSWGRMNRYRRSLTTRFQDRASMLQFLESTLKRRHQHHYQIIAKSEMFPDTPTLALLPTTNHIAGQLLLF